MLVVHICNFPGMLVVISRWFMRKFMPLVVQCWQRIICKSILGLWKNYFDAWNITLLWNFSIEIAWVFFYQCTGNILLCDHINCGNQKLSFLENKRELLKQNKQTNFLNWKIYSQNALLCSACFHRHGKFQYVTFRMLTNYVDRKRWVLKLSKNIDIL